jgi:hypothetical protein
MSESTSFRPNPGSSLRTAQADAKRATVAVLSVIARRRVRNQTRQCSVIRSQVHSLARDTTQRLYSYLSCMRVGLKAIMHCFLDTHRQSPRARSTPIKPVGLGARRVRRKAHRACGVASGCSTATPSPAKRTWLQGRDLVDPFSPAPEPAPPLPIPSRAFLSSASAWRGCATAWQLTRA